MGKKRTSSDTRQAKVGAHEELFPARELLDAPHERRLFGHVVHRADRRAELGRVGVVGHGDVDLHVVGRRTALELRLDLHVHVY